MKIELTVEELIYVRKALYRQVAFYEDNDMDEDATKVYAIRERVKQAIKTSEADK